MLLPVMVEALAALIVTLPAVTPGAEPAAELREVEQRLVAEAAQAQPGMAVGIAVQDLTTGGWAGVNADLTFVSASAAKVIWVAAAVKRRGVQPVRPLVGPIFRTSDNDAAGQVLQLIGTDKVNDFYAEVGMTHSLFVAWKDLEAPGKDPSSHDNLITARDAVTFLQRLDSGAILGPAETALMRRWLRWAPRSGEGGWLAARLPPQARALVMHKAGWLPPGCCGGEAHRNVLTELGIVQVPHGHRYAVALLTAHGARWREQAAFVERASRQLYDVVAKQGAAAQPSSVP